MIVGIQKQKKSQDDIIMEMIKEIYNINGFKYVCLLIEYNLSVFCLIKNQRIDSNYSYIIRIRYKS